MKKVPYEVNILSINGDHTKFAYYLEYVKENSKSIYAESPMYGWTYRIEKDTNKVYIDGKLWGVCEYNMSYEYC